MSHRNASVEFCLLVVVLRTGWKIQHVAHAHTHVLSERSSTHTTQ